MGVPRRILECTGQEPDLPYRTCRNVVISRLINPLVNVDFSRIKVCAGKSALAITTCPRKGSKGGACPALQLATVQKMNLPENQKVRWPVRLPASPDNCGPLAVDVITPTLSWHILV